VLMSSKEKICVLYEPHSIITNWCIRVVKNKINKDGRL
jgi:hypothetical protein